MNKRTASLLLLTVLLLFLPAVFLAWSQDLPPVDEAKPTDAVITPPHSDINHPIAVAHPAR